MRCDVFRWLHGAPFGFCRKFNQQTTGGTEVGAYTELLRKMVSEITGLQEEKGIKNLFHLGEIGSGSILGLDDYSLAVKNPRLTDEQKLWSSGAKYHFVFTTGGLGRWGAENDGGSAAKICPIEVKSGRYQRHTSFDKFRSKFHTKLGQSYILYTKDLMEKDGILRLPLYMAMFL